MEQKAPESAPGTATENRISSLTLVIGLASALVAAILQKLVWGAGIAIGAALAWLNFRLLKRGLDALAAAAMAQAGRDKPAVPLSSYFGMVFRYGLIALSVYVIFKFLKVPLLSMVLGLCALGAATIAASVYEIFHPPEPGGSD
jgi:small-conductance mechanosensitive channel